jgi:hypothetical protein
MLGLNSACWAVAPLDCTLEEARLEDERRVIRQVGMASSGGPPPDRLGSSKESLEMTPQAAAEYIASLLRELIALAQRAQMPFLAYLLGMALQEAEARKKGQGSRLS